MNKNIQIKIRNEQQEFENVYPKTKAELVEGLEAELTKKVEKVTGKQLSTEDFTTVEKTKLAGIEIDANNYIHPSVHPASIITESSTKRFVSDTEKASWTGKQDSLGFTPENTANKGKANGYPGLDTNAKIPLNQLPDIAKSQTHVVTNAATRNALSGMLVGDRAFETATGDSYIWNGTAWLILSKADWENVNLQWSNIVGKPASTTVTIDDAVNKRHTHANQAVLDKIRATDAASSYDLSEFVKQSELGNAGFGDMLKSVYDKNNNGKIDAAETADSVPWTGVSGKPTTFAPSTHTHTAVQVTESSAKRFVSDSEKALWNGKSKVVVSATAPVDADIWYEEI